MTTKPFSPFGTNLFGEPIEQVGGQMARDFYFPPFSVLDARSGAWQERKRAWLSLGIVSELGRAKGHYASTEREGMDGAYDTEQGQCAWGGSTTSIFDPVLCELAYRWFSPEGGHVLDPFAGGSVRGIVAALLGRRYLGIDLRREQIAANIEQATLICPAAIHRPEWLTGDSALIRALTAEHRGDLCPECDRVPNPKFADLIFSCPPYADLEVYSAHPADISNMEFPQFLAAYGGIIREAVALLKPDRFAAFVVGDMRDKKGNYRNFPGHTIRAFEEAGLSLYNECILLTPAGSLPLRAGAAFRTSRKLGKSHQNILVFVKGDGRKAAEACKQIDDEKHELAGRVAPRTEG